MKASNLSFNRVSIAAIGIGAAIALFSMSALFAHADVGAAPTIVGTIVNGSNATITTSPIGTLVQNNVVIASSSAVTPPSGTVDFNLYANQSCTGSPTTQTGVTLVNGMAQSASTTVAAAGLSYIASYSGDASNTPITSPCVSLAATASNITIATALSTSTASAGSSVFDTAVLSGLAGSATGTVAYTAYTDNLCTAGAVTGGSKTVAAGVVPNSDSLLFNTPGTYYWNAAYSGDQFNTATTSACVPVVINAVPLNTSAIATALSSNNVNVGSSVNDTATLSGITGTATGTVAYTAYTDNLCTAGAMTAGTKTVAAGVVPNSDSLLFNTAGTYYWQAVYSGDQSNLATTSSCIPLTVSAVPLNTSTITTALSSSTILAGLTAFDTAVLSGVTGTATGTVAYSAYTNNTCTTGGVAAGTKTVAAGVVPNSDPLMFNVAGTYYWQGIYSGDQSNTATTSTCIPLTVVATTTPVIPPTTASSTISGTVYNDANKNEAKDAGEVGISGFTINLYQGAGWSGPTNKVPFMTTVSDVNGVYSFGSLADGTYSVEEINQPTWKQDTSDYSPVVIVGGVAQSGLDFGNTTKVASTTGGTAAISGTVYNDLNKNESLDAGEGGISGFTINLYKGAGANSGPTNKTPFMTMTTDGNGAYSFANLANGIYSVEEIGMTPWHQDTPDYNSVVITNAASMTNINFANSSTTSSTGGSGSGKGGGSGSGTGVGNGNGGSNNGNTYGGNKGGDSGSHGSSGRPGRNR